MKDETIYPLAGLHGDITYKSGFGDYKFITEDKMYVLAPWSRHPYHLTVIIRKGYWFNGANLPRFLWPFFGHPFETPRDRAALIHDAAYDEKFISRRQADRLYRICLGELGYGAVQRWVEWFFIRLFGWIAWRRAKGSRFVDVRHSGGAT